MRFRPARSHEDTSGGVIGARRQRDETSELPGNQPNAPYKGSQGSVRTTKHVRRRELNLFAGAAGVWEDLRGFHYFHTLKPGLLEEVCSFSGRENTGVMSFSGVSWIAKQVVRVRF